MVLMFSRSDILNKKIPNDLLGVYYFLNHQDNILYIGKSVDVRKRISQHLAKGRKRLVNTFHKLKVKKLHSELESLLFESQEIKKYRPIFNRRLRRYKNHISLLTSKDPRGYHFYRLADDVNEQLLISFFSKRDAKKFILDLTQKHNLCEKINGLDKSSKSCFQYHLRNCNGACVGLEDKKKYNLRFKESFENILLYPNDCKLVFVNSKTYVIIKNNEVCEFGVESVSKWVIKYPSRDEIRIINTFKNRLGERVKQIKL